MDRYSQSLVESNRCPDKALKPYLKVIKEHLRIYYSASSGGPYDSRHQDRSSKLLLLFRGRFNRVRLFCQYGGVCRLYSQKAHLSAFGS
jgi:hypothetical protein